MKTKIGIGLLLLGITQAALSFEAVEIVPYEYPIQMGSPKPGTGFAFGSASNVVITSLGYDLLGISSVTGRVVLVDAAGVVLRSASISTNNSLFGSTYYKAIPPIVIAGGTTNYLFVFGRDSDEPSWLFAGIVFPTNQFTMGQGLQFLYGLQTDQETTPAQYQFLPFLLEGVNFQYVFQPTPPPLQISLTSTNTILLSWPTQVVNCVLQSAGDFAGSMTNVSEIPAIVGTNCTVVVPADAPQRFFRLSN